MPRLFYSQLKQFIRRQVNMLNSDLYELARELNLHKRSFDRRKLVSEITKSLMSIFQQEKREMGPEIYIIPTDDTRLKPTTKTIYGKVNKKVAKTWLKERKPRQTKPYSPNYQVYRPSFFDSRREQDADGSRQVNFYRQFRNSSDNEIPPKRVQKEKKNKSKGSWLFKKTRNGNTFYNEGQAEQPQEEEPMEEINFSSNKDMVSKYIKRQLHPDRREDLSAANLAKIQDDLSSILASSLDSEDDVYIELGISDFRGEKEREVAKRQTKHLELEQSIVDILRFKPASKFYYSELFNVDSLSDRIATRRLNDEISASYLQKAVTSESSPSETAVRDALLDRLRVDPSPLKDREMKEKFYSLLIQKYERILCSDDANWLEKKLAIAEDQERNLDSFKQIRSESLILKERFSWLQKLKNLLLVCRMSYLTAKGNSKSHSFELFKALLDRTLSIAISVETPSFDFHRLQKIL